MSFYLNGDEDSTLRLKTYSAVSKGGKSYIKIEVEVLDFYELGYVLKGLSEVDARHRAADVAKKKAASQKPANHPTLALPAPLKALPKP